MKLIRLSKSQTQVAQIWHPVFDQGKTITDAQNEELLLQYLAKPTDELRHEIVLSNLHLVRHTVGRYLAHWAETRRWEDDLISVGLMTLMERIEKLSQKTATYFRPWTITHLKNDIERYLNNNRTSVAPSLMTNYRRLKAGQQIESKPDIPLTALGEDQ